MSIATLSNLEAKDGPRMNDVIISVSEQVGIDSMHFSMPSEEFAEKIRKYFPFNADFFMPQTDTPPP